jgi:prolipoprotein diacylglyceryltransferase
LLEVSDRLAPSFAAGTIVHRVANLFNSEIAGKPTDGIVTGLTLSVYLQSGAQAS